ncbi:MAG: PAS domain S-box protein [Chitinivibrionales bacterium]|nr:PAS domain S-box protein [Chitinivibrionales bacterium]
METTTIQQYKEYVGDNLDQIKDILSRITCGDYSSDVDIDTIPDNEFAEVLRSLKVLISNYKDANRSLHKQTKYDNIRAEIWKTAFDKSLTVSQVIERLFEKVGPQFSIMRASYYEFDLENKTATCTLQWCGKGMRPTRGLQIPESVYAHFLGQEYVSITSRRLPDSLKPQIQDIFKQTGVNSFLAILFPDASHPAGFISFSDNDPTREWQERETDILREIVKILVARITQSEAEEALRQANEQLEEQVRARTDELRGVNARLREDVEKRKQMHLTLEENEERYRALIETSPDSIAMIDLQGNFMMVNNVAVEMHGYNDKEVLLGKNFFDFVVEKDRLQAREASRHALSTGSIKNIEYELLRSDGSTYLAEMSASLLRDSHGNAHAFICIIRDISVRKKAEQELEAEKELLDVTLRSISDGVISADINGRVMSVNSIAETLTGWQQDEADSRYLEDIFSVVEQTSRKPAENPVRKVIERNGIVYFRSDRLLVAKNGYECQIEYSGAPIRDRKGSIIGVVIVFRDVTEKQKLEGEVFKARKLESIGVLAGGIAHDFNNILTGIVTNLFMAKMNIRSNDEVKQLIMEAEKAAFRASRLTKQLLTFSKGGSPVKENASIKEIIEDSVGFCLSGSNVDYKLSLPAELWQVEVDRGQVDQVINNLVINADQAMPQGGTVSVGAENITIGETIKEGTASILPLMPGNYVKISIEDEGVGIEPDNIEKIFDPYFSTKPNASGLGLTTAFSIVKKHDGHITVRSIPGKGSRFVFYLPAVKSEEDLEETKEMLPLRGAGNRVLVMDDDEIVRLVVQRLLKRAGYEVSCTENGEDTIQRYRTAFQEGKPFDVVIMDLTVPGAMGGREAIKKLLQIDPDAKVIVFSGYSNDPVMSNYKEFGFSGVIAKPFSIDEFTRVIGRIMERS